jgi:hypothetical protein
MITKEKAPVRRGNANPRLHQPSQTAKFEGDRYDEGTLFPIDFQRLSTASGRSPSCPTHQTEACPEIRIMSGNSGSNRSSSWPWASGVAIMLHPYEFYSTLPVIPQPMIDHLLDRGVEPLALGSGANWPLKLANGLCATDGWFDADEFGSNCYAVPIDDGSGVIDLGFWDARSGHTARLLKCGCALGEEQIDNPGTYGFGGHLKIHASPLGWLRSGRDGIFIFDWGLAFDRLRYCPRIAIDACLLPTYRAAMQPTPMPELFVVADDKEAA